MKSDMTFMEHLEALRWHLIRSVIAIFAAAITLFFFKNFLFDDILFAPKQPDFITYRALCKLSYALGLEDRLCIHEIPFELFNPDISGQFTLHMWASLVGGLVISFPYVVWEIWSFVKPGLRPAEKSSSTGLIFYTSSLFITGILFGYYVISPLSIHFLGTYQVSASVKNIISMDSFISTLVTITLAAGIIFELPVAVYFLTLAGIMSPGFMRTYRRHALVVILIVAAIITPSPDVTSQILVALPLYVLYEVSIFVSVYVIRKKSTVS